MKLAVNVCLSFAVLCSTSAAVGNELNILHLHTTETNDDIAVGVLVFGDYDYWGDVGVGGIKITKDVIVVVLDGSYGKTWRVYRKRGSRQ